MDVDRLLRPNPFAGDRGRMSPAMREALDEPDPGRRLSGVVAAVAAGEEWAAPWDNPRVLEGFERALSEGGHPARVSLAPMHSGVIRLYVAIDAASEADAYRAVAAVVAAAEEDKCLRAHLDVVEVVPVSANSHA